MAREQSADQRLPRLLARMTQRYPRDVQPRIQFIHGLEGSPQGAKARLLAEHFETCTPAMDTHDFEACVRVQADSLGELRPDLLIGSSFGAAVRAMPSSCRHSF